MSFSTTPDSFCLENNRAIITFSKQNALVSSIRDKQTGAELKGEDTYFFSLVAQDRQTVVPPTAIAQEGDLLHISTDLGSFSVKIETDDDYFTFELVTPLPTNCFKARIAHAKYSYDFEDKSNTGACGIALTFWANPCFFPDAKDLETKAEVTRHLRDLGAKYALIIAPICEQRDLIKKVSSTIDPEKGLVSPIGGAWGRDSRLNFGNYIMVYEMSDEFLREKMDFLKSMGVDQVDIHKWPGATFSSGDFTYAHYKDHADFKARVSDVLEANGMSAGLHTYTFLLDYESESMLSDPNCQKDFALLETFTLAEDLSETADFVPTVESTAEVSDSYAFFHHNTPFVLIDEEIIRFVNHPHGFPVAERGACGTKAVPHKKGTPVKHIDGYFNCIAPQINSDLFYQIARNTAHAFNEGGYKMIYLDGLDGLWHFTDREEETWYYSAAFVHEIVKNCNRPPLIEYSAFVPSIWPTRGRIGAWDATFRGYKKWNREHALENRKFIDRYSAGTLGWYLFYPLTEAYPGNEHTKYHHSDAVEHIGSLALMYDYSIVYTGSTIDDYPNTAAVRRNIEIYQKYDRLRKEQYFSESTRKKLQDGPWEYHLKEKSPGQFVFEEKDYQTKKLYNLSDPAQNSGKFSNPFAEQTPFVRIEALLSTHGDDPKVLLPLDKTVDLVEQPLSRDFDGEIDLSEHIAKKVSVLGNGKKGGAIAITMKAGTNSEQGYAIYIIDTDFEGWRDFVLVEADNGERLELGFESEYHKYAIYRSGLKHERSSRIFVETTGDMTGVKMSDIVAVEHTFEVLKNPTVTVNDTSLTFRCELMSTDFIEYDGETAKVIDRYGNEKTVYCSGDLTVPAGEFSATLTCKALNHTTPRAQLTFGFTGKEIE